MNELEFVRVVNGKIVPQSKLKTQIVLWLLALGAIVGAMLLADPHADEPEKPLWNTTQEK